MNRLLLFLLLLCSFSLYPQQTNTVDFKKVNARITPNLEAQSIHGTVSYTFKVLKKTDSIFLDARIDQLVNWSSNSGLFVEHNNSKVWITGDFSANSNHAITLEYTVKPRQTLYFFNQQLWTQGQGKYTSYWLPSLDDMNDKMEFDLTVVMPEAYTVVANGTLQSKADTNGYIAWEFNMQKPMSSYLVLIAAGIYNKQLVTSNSGIRLENYFYPNDSLKVEPTYRHTKQIFDFFERKIGVAYPWQNYKQLPVRDFLYAGMENTTATVFSEAFVTDSIGFFDRNYVNVNAHELAHQWFGNLVTEVSAGSHWLHEGFATYYALLAEREIFGDDYYYWKLYQSAEQLRELSEQGKGEALSNPKASSLTFYEKGAWALHILNEQLGTLYFDTAVKTFLERFAYKNATITDFLEVVEEVAKTDLTVFKKDWINQTAFKSQQALTSLTKNKGIVAYFKAQGLRNQPWEVKKQLLFSLINSSNPYVAQEAVYQLVNEPIDKSLPGYALALDASDYLVRQAVASSLTTVPLALQDEYEGLLQEESYVTQEAALYNLWNSFPEHQTKYLNQTKSYLGFQNKNLRQLWLVLALVTEGYQPQSKRDFIVELIDYASSNFSFEVRDLALNYLFDLGIVNTLSLTHLINACVHPNWRFRSNARSILEGVIQDAIAKDIIVELLPSLTQQEQDYLKKQL